MASGRCDAHGGPTKAWAKKPGASGTKRLSGSKGDARKRRLLAREPLCRTCAKAGRATVATTRDHIVPLAEGGAEDCESNEQPLCVDCHAAKTREESKRGVMHAW